MILRHASIAILAAVTFSAANATNFVLNGSFENPTYSSSWVSQSGGDYLIGAPTSWNLAGVGGVFRPDSSAFSSVPDGVNVGFVSEGNNAGTLSQTLSYTITGNEDIIFDGYIGDRKDIGAGNFYSNVSTLGIASIFTTSNVFLGSVTVSSPGGSGIWTYFNIAVNKTALTPYVGQGLKITLATAGSGKQASFDNIGVQAVPEPASMTVLGLGLAAVLRRRKA
jgi:uncharacterized protein (TIGR03382 family)